VGGYVEIILDKSVVCREEICIAGDRLHLKGNVIILQQRLLISLSPSLRGGGEDGEHSAGAYCVDVEGEEDENGGCGGGGCGAACLDGGVDARILALRNEAHA